MIRNLKRITLLSAAVLLAGNSLGCSGEAPGR